MPFEMSRTAHSRNDYDYLLRQEAKTKIAWERYLGKLAIAQSLVNRGKEIPIDLALRIRLAKTYLAHRGEDV